jgi:hypothetical protein
MGPSSPSSINQGQQNPSEREFKSRSPTGKKIRKLVGELPSFLAQSMISDQPKLMR